MKNIYTVLSAIRHDGKSYAENDTINLDENEAAELIAAGVLVKSDTPIIPSDADERQAAIIAAIGQLDAANGDAWLKDGKPSSDAIAAITGWPLSATERNSAWATIQPAV